MYESRKAGEIVTIPHVDTIADGIAVKTPGGLTYSLINEYVDDLITVTDDEIAHTAYLMLQRTKNLAEPSGVASVAAILNHKYDFGGKNVAAIVSGGNINMSLLEQIVEQGMLQEGLRTTMQVIIPDQSGELNKLTWLFTQFKISIQNIEHIRSTSSVPIGRVMVVCTVNLQNQEQLEQLTDELKSRGLQVRVLN